MAMTNHQVARSFGSAPFANVRSGNGTLFVSNGTIYSYGAHFPIARHVGGNTVLFNGASYSVTTSRHQSLVRAALPRDVTVIHVPDVTAETQDAHESNLIALLTEARDMIDRASRSRNELYRNARLDNANDRLFEARVYASMFLRDAFLPQASVYSQTDDARQGIEEAISRISDSLLSRRRRRQEYLRQRFRELDPFVSFVSGPVMLRYRNGLIETSHGYHTAMSQEVRDLFRAAALARRRRKGRKLLDLAVGAYKVNRIYPNGDIKIGCQLIPWAETERVAKEIGLIETEKDAKEIGLIETEKAA